jgi:O-acetyl-ADP-ribose deacetylase (regulator of RNase III)
MTQPESEEGRGGGVVVRVGDLFDSGADAYAHCVSADFHMGAGIARHVRKLYGRPDASLSDVVGGVRAQAPDPPGGDAPDVVYHMITKRRYRDRPEPGVYLAALTDCLLGLRELCDRDRVRRLAMPRVGCGLDGMRWDDVLPLIEAAFAGAATRVEVWDLPSRSARRRARCLRASPSIASNRETF